MDLFLNSLLRLRWVFVFCLVGIVFTAPGNSLAGEPAIGTCDCTGGTCSIYRGNGQWEHVDSCSSGSSSSEGIVAAQLNGAYMAQNSAATELATEKYSYEPITVTLVPNGREFKLQEAGYGGSSSGPGYGSSLGHKFYQPAAKDAMLTESGLGIAVDYAHANFSATSIINGTQRKSDVYGVTLLYGQDFGSWDYTFSMPIKNQDNNGDFDAFDNSSLGLAVLPRYHLLLQQVHGINFDVGAVFGYEYHWYKHKSKLTDNSGKFAFGSFDNPSSLQVGPVARLGWKKGGTALSGSLSYIDFRNLSGETAYGRNSALTTAGLGIQQIVWKGGIVGFDYAHNRLHNISSADLDYNEASILVRQVFGSSNSLSLRTSRIFSNADYRAVDTMLIFTRQL